MAVTEEPETEIASTTPVVTYSAVPQICGFPWRIGSSSIFSIGPLTGPQTGLLAPEIHTSLRGPDSSTGVRIYLREFYQESVVTDGVSYYWGGQVTDPATGLAAAEIVVRDYADETDENVIPSLNIFTGATTPATIMWQIAIVRFVDGEYYLCDTLIPPDNTVPSSLVFPDDFDTDNPL